MPHPRKAPRSPVRSRPRARPPAGGRSSSAMSKACGRPRRRGFATRPNGRATRRPGAATTPRSPAPMRGAPPMTGGWPSARRNARSAKSAAPPGAKLRLRRRRHRRRRSSASKGSAATGGAGARSAACSAESPGAWRDAAPAGVAAIALGAPVGALIGDAIARLLDCDEQRQAAAATEEAVRGGVGTTTTWVERDPARRDRHVDGHRARRRRPTAMNA